jgi:hypothetical protein
VRDVSFRDKSCHLDITEGKSSILKFTRVTGGTGEVAAVGGTGFPVDKALAVAALAVVVGIDNGGSSSI